MLDVYYIKDGKQITSRTGLTDENKIGTLSQVLANPYAADGHIHAGENGDDEMVENLMLDFRIQYALHTTSFEEQPLSDRPGERLAELRRMHAGAAGCLRKVQ